MTTRLLAAIALLTGPALAAAQSSIYESRDKAGPVFSDQPSPGAKTIDLPPPSVIQTDPARPSQPAPAAAAPYYTAFAITSPENGGTVHSNTGAFDVGVRLEPALRSARGDWIQVRLDGKVLARSHGSAKVGITDADWQGAASPNAAEHTLQLAIVDSAGGVLIESVPVRFFARRATVKRERR